MADNSSNRGSNIKCSFHNQDYRLYCKECKDCICMECLEDDLHHMHSFCKLKDARNDILKELQTFIANNGEHDSETADHFSKAVKRKIEEFKDAELLIKNQVNVGAEEMIRHIKTLKDELLISLEKRFLKYNEHIKTYQDSLETVFFDINNVDPDTIKDDQVVDLLVKMRRCISTCKHLISQDEKPTFIQNPNCTLGYFTPISDDSTNAETISKSDDVIDVNNKPQISQNFATVDVKTDYNDIVIAKEREANQEESSSDEILDYPITISFDNEEEEEVEKIIPISDQDAWLIISRQLRKIENRVLESTKYATADDFVVLKDGSVLVLKRNDKFIKKLLLDGRIVPFSCMDIYYPSSLFLTDNFVFVNLRGTDCESRTVFSRIDSFDFDGIMSSTLDVSFLNLKGSADSAISVNEREMILCILGRYNFRGKRLSIINLVKQKKEEAKPTTVDLRSFQGSFGISPQTHFVCKGICVDKNNTILYSDATYGCVNALNEDMKFKKFVVSSSDYNLESPGAIAIYNDHLWVADSEKILIFKYDADEIKIY